MVWMQLRPVCPWSRTRAEGGDLHVQIGVLDRRRRPYGGHELIPRDEVSGPLEKHVENVKGT
jgi:hypothetical protein